MADTSQPQPVSANPLCCVCGPTEKDCDEGETCLDTSCAFCLYGCPDGEYCCGGKARRG